MFIRTKATQAAQSRCLHQTPQLEVTSCASRHSARMNQASHPKARGELTVRLRVGITETPLCSGNALVDPFLSASLGQGLPKEVAVIASCRPSQTSRVGQSTPENAEAL